MGTRPSTLDLGGRWKIVPVFHVSIQESYRKRVRASQKQDRPLAGHIEGELDYGVEAIIASERSVNG